MGEKPETSAAKRWMLQAAVNAFLREEQEMQPLLRLAVARQIMRLEDRLLARYVLHPDHKLPERIIRVGVRAEE